MSQMEELSKLKTSINSDKKRFELPVGKHTAIIEYILNKNDVMYLVHTEVPPALEGQGVGNKIVQDALLYVRNNNLKLAPLCPFVAAYIKRHPEYADILADGFKVS